ncbi:MAG: recombination mediator RecR [Succinivibrionaceae bacterium]|nr:recombination mediator RecR [Succinivibrionaceae bacterium]
MKYTPLIDNLITDLQAMPGVGKRSAQRIAFYMLDRNREAALKLSESLRKATEIGYCQRCFNFCEEELCDICKSPKRREENIICVVETPADAYAIESTEQYFGTYFVLHGSISPIDAIGPEELHLDVLKKILEEDRPKELIIATNATVEGEATAHLIASYAEQLNIPISRPAYGIPFGSDLDNIDNRTLTKSLAGRIRYSE